MTLRAKKMETAEAYITFFNDLMLERRTAIPGKITRINKEGSALVSVDVQAAISHTITQDDGITLVSQELPIISGVPIVIPRSQTTGFSLTIPIAVGDDVLLVFGDRSIDNWQSTGKVSAPAEPSMPRSHDLTDAIAIVGIFNDTTSIPNYSFDAITLRNKDGTTCVSVSDSVITIKNNDINITVDGSEIKMVNGSSSISIESNEIKMVNGSSSIKIESDKIIIDSPLVEINGAELEMASTSNVTTGGGLTSSGGLDFDSHVHSNPEGGNTGPPANP